MYPALSRGAYAWNQSVGVHVLKGGSPLGTARGARLQIHFVALRPIACSYTAVPIALTVKYTGRILALQCLPRLGEG